MKIRKASKKDIKEIQNLSVMFNRDLPPWNNKPIKYSKKAKKYLINSVVRNFKNKNAVYFVAVDKETLIGYAYSYIEKEPYGDKNFGVISEVFVLKEYRLKGIGTKLFKEVLSWLKKKGVKGIEVNISIKNKTTIRFIIKKCGFREQSIFYYKKF